MNLIDFCQNDYEKNVIETYQQYGSDRKAAVALNCGKTHVGDVRRRVQERAANKDHYNSPDGYFVKGVSQLVDEDGKTKLTWIKTAVDKERQYELWQEAVEALTESIPKLDPVESPLSVESDLLSTYVVSDHHIGMLSWDEETGQNYDTKRAEQLLMASIDHLLWTNANSSSALITILGDFLHFDSLEAVTPTHRNLLDSDTRYANIVRVAIRAVRYMISKALQKHSTVSVICEIGNHDMASMIFLAETLAHIYENEPRVSIDRSPSKFHYFRFGKVLIGTTHGDTIKKLDQLPLIMATDRAEDWGATEFRYWFLGHVHHSSMKDYVGCTVETFRVLAPVDAYAHGKGYRGITDMKSITYHKDYGEVARSIFNPKMIA